MADNYLEKRYEEVFCSGANKAKVKKVNPSLDSLLLRNRSHRSFNPEHPVRLSELKTMIGASCRVASAMNRQALRFRPVLDPEEKTFILGNIRLGAALPQMKFPPKGAEPSAYILVCTSEPEDRYIDIDLGMALQAMGLKAVELGLNATVVCSFSNEVISEGLGLPQGMKTLAVLAVGKGAEKIQLLSIRADEDHAYFYKDGIHYVPKVCLDELLIP